MRIRRETRDVRRETKGPMNVGCAPRTSDFFVMPKVRSAHPTLFNILSLSMECMSLVGRSPKQLQLTSNISHLSRQRGVTLIEMVVFIIVLSIGLTAMVSAMNNHLSNSVDPIVNTRALECAQAKLDEISARKFDENSPTGGVPACGSGESGAVACLGIVPDGDFDDVGDFNSHVDNSDSNCAITVTVVNAGGDLGINADQARRVTVDVVSPGGGRATISTYRTNF